MRIATLSDLHTDHADNRDALVKLAVAIHEGQPDLVVVAGDISHKDDRIARTLEALSVVAPRVAYLPGNHDLWLDVPYAPARADLDSWVRHDVELRKLSESLGVHYLPAGPLYLGSAAVVGSCGWYDGGFLLEHIARELPDNALRDKQLGGAMWSDARFIAFRDAEGALMEDAAVARRMEAQMQRQLAEAQDRSEVQDIVAVTHHLAFEQAVLRTGSLPWEFFNAFMGSPRMGEVILRASKVSHVVYGHTHRRGRFELEGRTVYGTPLGYPRERVGLDEAGIIRACIGWIELPSDRALLNGS